MHVAELWRYPVKSLAGESLAVAELTPGGLAGDRVVQVYDRRGRVVTARTRPALLGLHATLGPDGAPWIDGRPWSSPEALAAVRAATEADARLAESQDLERFFRHPARMGGAWASPRSTMSSSWEERSAGPRPPCSSAASAPASAS